MYWISLSKPYPETDISILNSMIKRYLNPFVFVVVLNLHAASRNPLFLYLPYEKLKLDATFVSGLQC